MLNLIFIFFHRYKNNYLIFVFIFILENTKERYFLADDIDRNVFFD